MNAGLCVVDIARRLCSEISVFSAKGAEALFKKATIFSVDIIWR